MAQAGGRWKRRGQGEGTIYQRASDGKWVGSANLGWVDGRRVRKAVYGANQNEVIAKLRKLHADIDKGLPAVDERVTVEQLLERWLTDVVPGRVSPATLANYTAIVRHHLISALGKKRLTKLTPADVQSLLTRKQRERRPRRVAEKAGEPGRGRVG